MFLLLTETFGTTERLHRRIADRTRHGSEAHSTPSSIAGHCAGIPNECMNVPAPVETQELDRSIGDTKNAVARCIQWPMVIADMAPVSIRACAPALHPCVTWPVTLIMSPA